MGVSYCVEGTLLAAELWKSRFEVLQVALGVELEVSETSLCSSISFLMSAQLRERGTF